MTTKSAAVYSTVLLVAASLVVFQKRRRQKHHDAAACSSAYEQLIGNTPLIRLHHLSELVGRDIYVKMESLNPGGTGKDRAALRMIQQSESSGALPAPADDDDVALRATKARLNGLNGQPTHSSTTTTTTATNATDFSDSISAAMSHSRTGGLVVEGTSGSTGISLATLCAARGHGCIVVLPDDQAPEKKLILQTMGATVRVVPTASISNPQHYVNIARRVAQAAQKQGIDAVFINQFENLANFQTHYDTTGPELWKQAQHSIQAFCMSAGTGGTIAGVAQFLKEQDASIRIVLVDPPGSSLYHAIVHGVAYAPQQRERGLKRHRYDTIAEGIGLDRLTQNFTRGQEYISRAVRVSDQEAVDMAHYLLRTEGLWVGSSSAMNVVGAVRTALELPEGSKVVTVVCDSGQRHVTRFWNKEFITNWGLEWPNDGDERVPECLEHERVPECLKQVSAS